jgi:hypothetical protein
MQSKLGKLHCACLEDISLVCVHCLCIRQQLGFAEYLFYVCNLKWNKMNRLRSFLPAPSFGFQDYVATASRNHPSFRFPF